MRNIFTILAKSDFTTLINGPHYIYVVDDDLISRNDWCLSLYGDGVTFRGLYKCKNVLSINENDRRIILTNDPKLINDGVQPLDVNFIKEYVKNQVPVVNIETKYYGKDKGKYVEFPIDTVINPSLLDDIQVYYEVSIPNKTIQFPETNIISEWLEKNSNPEIAKQVEDEAEELFNMNTDDDMIKFLSFVNKNYIRVKGYYYMKGDYEKKMKISDPRELLKLFKKRKNDSK